MAKEFLCFNCAEYWGEPYDENMYLSQGDGEEYPQCSEPSCLKRDFESEVPPNGF